MLFTIEIDGVSSSTPAETHQKTKPRTVAHVMMTIRTGSHVTMSGPGAET